MGKEHEAVKAIYKKPGKEPEIIEVENELGALAEKIDGDIEKYDIAVDACVICDKEWERKYYASKVICGKLFGGPILIVGADGEEFCDLPQPEVVKELIWPTREDARYKK